MYSWQAADLHALSSVVAGDNARPLGWADKATLPSWYGRTPDEVAGARPELDELSTPIMTLDDGVIAANIAAMHEWVAERGLLLAPHGKTTMAPSLWLRQLRAGCWAITVANEPQLRMALAMGVPRIILANLFIRPDALVWLAEALAAQPATEFYCWVDSSAAVQQMNEALSASAAGRLNMVVEIGEPNGRTGARTVAAALELAQLVRQADRLRLAGVAGFEGVVAHDPDAAGLAAVDGFLQRMVAVHRELGGLYEVEHPILSAGGSAFFDRVAAVLGPQRGEEAGAVPGTLVVLRSGAYVVHDDGYYREVTPALRGSGPQLRSAMHVWARVISVPEPGVAFLDAGKRDVPYDQSLPEPQLLRQRDSSGSVVSLPLVGHLITATNDQHARMALPAGSPVMVGDVVRLGLSHPCTAFDKWSLIPMLDDANASSPAVTGFVRTYF